MFSFRLLNMIRDIRKNIFGYMFNERTLREILHSPSGNVMRTWTETKELADLGEKN